MMTESDSHDIPADSGEVPAPEKKEKAGELLKREREKLQLTVENVAQRLRLNAKYIEALEESRYDRLPGDTYIRVYLRSLSRFLSLDTEDILRRFFQERGLSADEVLNKDRSKKLTLAPVIEKKGSSHFLSFSIILIIVLAAVVFLARKNGWLSHGGKPVIAVTDSVKTAPPAAVPAESTKTASSAVAESTLKKSAAQVGPQPATPAESSKAQVGKPAPAPQLPAANGKVTVSQPVPSGNLLMLRVKVVGDSSKVCVFSDGKGWQKKLAKGEMMPFTAQDSFNVYVEQSGNVEVLLNGHLVPPPAKRGAVALKIDHSGVAYWTMAQWRTVFH